MMFLDLILSSATCGIGTYLYASAGACTLCAPGFFKSSFSDDASACALCPVGTQASPERDRCTTCAAGYACPDPRADPLPCEPGFWSPAGSAACVVCGAGMACASTSAPPLPCAVGRYANGGNTSCASCPVGASCADPAAAPVACLDGYYSALVRCSNCPRAVPRCLRAKCGRACYCFAGWQDTVY